MQGKSPLMRISSPRHQRNRIHGPENVYLRIDTNVGKDFVGKSIIDLVLIFGLIIGVLMIV